MQLLAVDPGAKRCGWAILSDGPTKPTLLASGVRHCVRLPTEEFQHYRLRLERESRVFFNDLLGFNYYPTKIINEIIPAVGGGNFSVATQSYLANCVVTVLHVEGFHRGLEVEQVAARSVQSVIGLKGRTGKVSKVGVRNGVLEYFPQLKTHISDKTRWPWDRWDAIAIGLYGLTCN